MIPLATDTTVRRTPWANYGLIVINVFIFMLERSVGGPRGQSQMAEWGMLSGLEPRLYQFFTYQFFHAGISHLGGNMLFLWVFGNAVNAKMGHLSYVLFYLAGGVFAGAGYLWGNEHNLIGASGAIAAVTTAFLAMFPRSRVTILYIFFFIGTFQLPSMILIVFKVILWDNVLAPSIMGASNVAFDAHLAGYAFGLVTICLMLIARILPRDQFDLVAVTWRALQRQRMRSAMSTPEAQARAQFGRVARPISFDDISVTLVSPAENDQVNELRAKVMEALDRGDRPEAAQGYEKLLDLDPRQVLGRAQQLEIASQFYTSGRYPQAAAAYEKFMSTYPSATEVNYIKLLLGIIYARDLHQYEVAEAHLRESLENITDERRREQCLHWLKVANDALGKPTPPI